MHRLKIQSGHYPIASVSGEGLSLPRSKKNLRSISRRLALILCSLILLGSPASTVASQQTSAKLKAKQQALEKVRKQIQRVSRKIDSGRKEANRLHQALEKAETGIAHLVREEHKLQQHIAKQNKRIATTQDRRKHLRKALAESRKHLIQQVRAAYRTGQQSRLKLFLTQHNPAEIGRMMSYYQYFIKARNQVIHTIQTQSARLKKTQQSLEKQRQKLQALDNQRKQTLAELKNKRSQRTKALGAIQEKLQRRSKKLASLKENRKHLKDLIQSLDKALARIPEHLDTDRPFPDLKGSLPRPLQGDALARFGQTKKNGGMEWEGLWLAAKEGQPIHAVAAGRVVYVGWMPSYGLFLIIDHGHGYYSLYAHDESVLTQTGRIVHAGEEIATAGNSGGHGRTGVYFEIRKGTTPLDPSDWLGSQ